ncbi:PQQ-dependent catabolism-associated CXXCW motif protein [Roseovarius sp. M141]|uniref:PQQ-dependent catabolism-associated CXXCW motif protein n=1 Tax=Roseovarius sp. M141 TaxID=2583806 RepID=UPI0020CC7618|nr:PQQ-dependent catabolism-associated CXXCW motif protein [Roseovarius sp. M141]MCQ0093114.1 PQQ-dependent catabolism-associated CXXCW motif protein [Roseovarius sp. M141]
MIRALLFALLIPFAAFAQEVPEPADYRMEAYLAPIPLTLKGATAVDAKAAFALWKTDRVAFVDVLPRQPKPKNLPEDTLWHDQPRISVPGAIWLPNVGYGAIAAETADYFKAGLDEATGGDPAMPIVVFCRDDCWMSWNAAKRVQEWGYNHVFWFRGGTDDWAAHEYPMEEVEAKPEP